MSQSSWAEPLNRGPMSKWTKNSESAFIFTQYPIKICVPSLEFQKKVEKGVLWKKSKKCFFLPKMDKNANFYPKFKS
jgi:hypothetical protein